MNDWIELKVIDEARRNEINRLAIQASNVAIIRETGHGSCKVKVDNYSGTDCYDIAEGYESLFKRVKAAAEVNLDSAIIDRFTKAEYEDLLSLVKTWQPETPAQEVRKQNIEEVIKKALNWA